MVVMCINFWLGMSLGHTAALDHWVIIELYDVVLLRGAGTAAVGDNITLWGSVDILITTLIYSLSGVHVIVHETLALEEVLATLLLLLGLHALAQLLDEPEDLVRIKREWLPVDA